jgi:hypothetical protein
MPLANAVIEFSANGDNTVITAPADLRVAVHQLAAVCSAGTTLRFKSGANSISGPIPVGALGALTLENTGEPWFVTNPGENLVINQSGSATVGGVLGYRLVR